MTSLRFIKGIGPKKAALFNKLGIADIEDLAFYFPRKWIDRRLDQEKKDLPFVSKAAVACGEVISAREAYAASGLVIFKAMIKRDGGGNTEAVFFKRRARGFDVFASLRKDFRPGSRVWITGDSDDMLFLSRIRAQEYYCDNDALAKKLHIGRIIPVYSLTEGLTGKAMRETVAAGLAIAADGIGDFLPARIRSKRALFSRAEALRSIHFPENYFQLEFARKRLIYEELLLFALACSIRRREIREIPKHFSYEVKRHLLTPFRRNLGFELTAGQKKAINEIFDDMMAPVPMARLLEGEVGSGKTVVALSAMLLVAENGAQSAFIAPTEILAQQHFFAFEKFLKGLKVRFELLTGSTPAAKRKKILEGLASGETDIIIGTHAILSSGVKFKNFRLAVVDEQHRFGVRQRAAMRNKGDLADMLVMTATPIPRSLFLSMYGDLDLSTIKELPAGRKPVKTLETDEQTAFDAVARETAAGNKVYIVYPAIEDSVQAGLKAVKTEFEKIKKFFPHLKIDLLHGRMKSGEKKKAMENFAAGDTQVLVATQVVEVGLDVPEASLMIINNAERFGLAALHQLRGRVGRGNKQSKCLLVCGSRTAESSERLAALVNCPSGFELSQKDIYLRGAGDIFTEEQHGDMGFKLADLSRDGEILRQAISDKDELLSIDPGISAPENAGIRAKLIEQYAGKWNLIDLS
ncbi:MAG: ATP-dependent DNA helicase RecG [Elusimicrobiales bacterium]|nr:ATP-dependent DNA helicase RecG [Elusimicrobiales bacterium]